MATYSLNKILNKEKKVELLDGSVVDITFTPLVVHKLYADMVGKQEDLSKIITQYNTVVNKLQAGGNQENLKEAESYLKDSKSITKNTKKLIDDIFEINKKIISITIAANKNDFEVDDDWFDSKSHQEINLILQIIIGNYEETEEDKKKLNKELLL